MKVLPDARRAAQLDLAAQQEGELAADGEAQAGAAVLAAGAGVGLLERLEDDALLLGRDADAGIGDLERHHVGRALEHGMGPRSSPPRAGDTARRTAALLGELERVREQVLEHLLQPLRVGDDGVAPATRRSRPRSRERVGFRPRGGTAGRRRRCRLVSTTSSAMTVTVPDSILERSRMSVMRLSRSVPAP